MRAQARSLVRPNRSRYPLDRPAHPHANRRSALREVPINRPIAERAGRIRREAGIRLPDALIAATALERSLTVAIRNIRDFKPVRGLRTRSLN